jgi:hypothetical protein
VDKGKREGPEPHRTLTLRNSPCLPPASTLYWLTVKNQPFCCAPATSGFWSSRLPAKSLAPMVTTALYLVFVNSKVEDVPNGLSVACRPSVLGLTLTLVTWMVLPSVLTLKNSPSTSFGE